MKLATISFLAGGGFVAGLAVWLASKARLLEEALWPL